MPVRMLSVRSAITGPLAVPKCLALAAAALLGSHEHPVMLADDFRRRTAESREKGLVGRENTVVHAQTQDCPAVARCIKLGSIVMPAPITKHGTPQICRVPVPLPDAGSEAGPTCEGKADQGRLACSCFTGRHQGSSAPSAHQATFEFSTGAGNGVIFVPGHSRVDTVSSLISSA